MLGVAGIMVIPTLLCCLTMEVFSHVKPQGYESIQVEFAKNDIKI